MPRPLTATGDWWAEFFDETFADVVLATHDGAQLVPTLDFLVERLALRPGDRVFDQGCGIGRLSLPLAERGLRVVGVDLSATYIERARSQAVSSDLPCELHAGDAFTFVPSEPCAGAFNWGTSFGFTDDDARNEQMLRRACESLLPGGRFVLEFPNTARVLRDLQTVMIQRSPTPAGEVRIVRETKANVARGMFEQQWTYELPDGRRHVRPGGTRMYLPHELERMLRAAGFAEVEFVGDLQGGPLTLDSARCIVIAHRG